ncbi:hypothetical protein BJ878DRAFT_337641 [Calycina marina]|uniref:Zn(2)-C6 fungal-type domain-containing protein n=1 Tax=Calycina marina TaxID=1763456 RepID=A0A9P8CGD0_9HELO|nr:hypothetical protein BJ878DRAFT_337641 [Calycina marina]
MAASVHLQYHTKHAWNSSEAHPLASKFIPDAPGSTMAYQYLHGSTGVNKSSGMIQSHHQNAEESSHIHAPSYANSTSPGIGGRGSSRPPKVKKSTSIPNVRGQASSEAAALALSAEKRRNKLGYHRTSVACGHCRRRKIRCIPAPADPQNRCSNCIRLKKECNFYPVDQQPQPEPRRGSKTQNGTDGISEASSPSTSSGHFPDIHSAGSYSNLSMPPIQDLGGSQMKRQRTESFSPEAKGLPFLRRAPAGPPDLAPVVTSSRNFEYSQGVTNWMASDISPGVKSHHGRPPPDSSSMYWRGQHQDSPMTPAFSPFTPSGQNLPVQTWPKSQPEPNQRDDASWPAPHRSMSYNNLEGGVTNPHQHPQSYQQASHSDHPPQHYTIKSRASHLEHYPPPPIVTSSSHHSSEYMSSATSESSPHHSQSAGALPPACYSHWQQPCSYQRPVVTNSESYEGWSSALPPAHHVSDGYAMPDPNYHYPPPR